MSAGGAYTDTELDYIRRVAGKVPVEAISAQLKRSKSSVTHACHERGISIRVPVWRLQKFWPEIIARRKQERQK